MFLLLRCAFVSLVAAVTLISASGGSGTIAATHDFEVWLIDQSDSNGDAFGGAIHIFDGNDLTGEDAASATAIDVLDLAADTATLCMASTGAHPVRPHMLSFNSTYSHAVLSFVAPAPGVSCGHNFGGGARAIHV